MRRSLILHLADLAVVPVFSFLLETFPFLQHFAVRKRDSIDPLKGLHVRAAFPVRGGILHNRHMFSSVHFHCIWFNSIQLKSIQFSSVQLHSNPFCSFQFNSIPFHSIQFCSALLYSIVSFHWILFCSIQFHST